MIKLNIPKKDLKEIEEIHLEWCKNTIINNIEDVKKNNTFKLGKINIAAYDDNIKLLEKIKKTIINSLEKLITGKKVELDKIIKLVNKKLEKEFKVLEVDEIYEYIKSKRDRLNKIRFEKNNDTEFKEIKKDLKEFIDKNKGYRELDKLGERIGNVILKGNGVIGFTIEDLKRIEEELYKGTDESQKTNMFDILKYIFNYKEFRNGSKIKYKGKEIQWGRHELLTKLGVNVCPYCNRQYITNYSSENDNDKTTGDLDHFYIQSEYPYLALSLYNFIPSCQVCNRTFKKSADFFKEPVIYPYNDDFGNDAKFKIAVKNGLNDNFIKELKEEYNPDVFIGMSDDFNIDFEISINSDKKEKIEKSIEVFKLREVYQSHKDYVVELVKKNIIYSDSRIDELFNEYRGSFFNTREEVVEMIVSNYITEENLDKRVLAKLIKDISEELGLR